MLITDPIALRQYASDQRIWQGIPSIEVTKKGRIFVTFYSGGTKEEIGNFAMVVKSDDGKTYSEPIVVADLPGHRCFDPCLWIDPLGRLWFTWSICPDDALYASICEDPDGEELVWGEPFKVGHDIMMNKPIVLSSGEWLFPIAVWNHGIRSLPPEFDSKTPEKGSFVYKTSDNGKTFVRLGTPDIEKRHFDEHMVLELQDGRLWMLVRTFYGIGQAFSLDRGKTWSAGSNSGLGGPSSRFHITRLKSGRILLINHVDFTRRNNLTALISEDDGKTWTGKLLLDGRNQVSYPDVKEADDGFIYITYDRERGGYKKNIRDAISEAREILVAKVTEEDILQGSIVTPGSCLRQIVSKLGEYKGPEKNPYGDFTLYTDRELAKILMKNKDTDEIIRKIFDTYPLNCSNSDQNALAMLDKKIGAFSDTGEEAILTEIIRDIRTLSGSNEPVNPTVERVTQWLKAHSAEDVSVAEIAEILGISQYYLCHLFRKVTGLTISDYRNELRLTNAKLDLIHTVKSVTQVALDAGYQSASYFGQVFQASEGMSPTAYRKYHKR